MNKKKYVYNYDRVCTACNKTFSTTNYSAKVCSKECTSQAIRNKKTLYSEADRASAISLRKSGKSIPEIMNLTGIKKPTLKKWFAESNTVLTKDQYDDNVSGARWKGHVVIDVNGLKACSSCCRRLPVDAFSIDRRRAGQASLYCRECQAGFYLKNAEFFKSKVQRYRAANQEKVKNSNRLHYEKNKDKIVGMVNKWQAENKEKVKQYISEYGKRTQKVKNARTATYRAMKDHATPPWLTSEHKQEIANIYKKCPNGHHVDHIVPLKGETVCGLHVPWNLRVVDSFFNVSKLNRVEADMSQSGQCFQYKRRLDTTEEDILNGCPINPPIREFTLSSEKYTKEHKDFIERYEWLGNVGYNVKYVFAARYNGLLGGVVIISDPNGTMKFDKEKMAQIQRGACASWTPKNLSSRLIMYSCRWMVNHTNARLFIAYSDPEAGEIGTVYQACNFEYVGSHYGSSYKYVLPDGKKVDSRYFTRTSSLKRWAKDLNIKWQPEWEKENGYRNIAAIPKDIYAEVTNYAKNLMKSLPTELVSPKGKYFLLLGKDRIEQNKLNKLKTWSPQPYPKRKIR